MARLYTADYSTGDFNQWTDIQNTVGLWGDWEGPNSAARPTKIGHSLQIERIGSECGYSGRFEARTGDVPSFGGGERTEVGAKSSLAKADIGTTRWYAFSIRFDENYPLIGDTGVSWACVHQFSYYPVHPTSPVIQFGYPTAGAPYGLSGYWYLLQTPQTARVEGGFTYTTNYGIPLVQMPLDRGLWQDIKVQATWKRDNTGMIRLWRNGIRQNFTAEAGGGDTFVGQTAIPDGTGANEQITAVVSAQGIYRNNPTTPTMIVHHTGFRMADTEDGL